MSIVESAPACAARLSVWDSRSGPPAEAFSNFRETICNEFMPWTPELIDDDFHARVESLGFESGTVGRVRMTSISATKTKSNIARSAVDCIHGNLILSGELKVEQGGRTNFAKPGELVLYQSYEPVVLTERSGHPFDNLAFIIPRSIFSPAIHADDIFRNVVVGADRLAGPLGGCLNLLVKELAMASEAELSGLFEACITLLPLVMVADSGERSIGVAKSGRTLREVLRYIDRNLSNPDLSPALVANQLGVSVRYIHKLFANTTETFGSYVTGRRLERVKWDLLASSKRPPIAAMAYRWGFGDLSTFNRAFKSKYACTPSRFRTRSDP
ncbi:helix-turn-helix domain-containing protein [Hyphomicrobium sp.]|uniref:helix-turn-helix domain-containing protein n=1 Tax=Hyphomicrobium sp. TaxID=82 RepID=UPI001D60F8F3|nr:helix-turn-helix domain-containing protein [Hyphomicrobium sp.]MBY0558245.1 helix-turn-helix domain-containing protein [Hyphomicrobium sp.]